MNEIKAHIPGIEHVQSSTSGALITPFIDFDTEGVMQRIGGGTLENTLAYSSRIVEPNILHLPGGRGSIRDLGLMFRLRDQEDIYGYIDGEKAKPVLDLTLASGIALRDSALIYTPNGVTIVFPQDPKDLGSISYVWIDPGSTGLITQEVDTLKGDNPDVVLAANLAVDWNSKVLGYIEKKKADSARHPSLW